MTPSAAEMRTAAASNGGDFSKWLLPVAAFAGALILRLPYVGFPLNDDEGSYAVTAALARSGEQLYADLYSARPPLLYAYYELCLWVESVTGVPIDVVIHLGAAVLVAVAAVVFAWAVTARLSSTFASTLATGLFVLMSGSRVIQALDANAESLMLLPLVAAGVFIMPVGKIAAPITRSFLLDATIAGFCIVAAMMVKQVAGVALALPVVTYFASRSSEQRRGLTRGYLFGVAGAGGMVLLWSLATGQLREFLVFGWIANFVYSANPEYRRDLEGILSSIWHVKYILSFPLAVAVIAGLVVGIRGCPSRPELRRLTLYAAIWIGLSLIAVSVSARYWAHYYIQVIPSMCLLVGAMLATLRERYPAGAAKLLAAAVAAVVLLGPIASGAKGLAAWPSERTAPETDVAPRLGGVISRYTAPSDRVLLWSTFDSALVYAERLAANRTAESYVYYTDSMIPQDEPGQLLGVTLENPNDRIIRQWKEEPPDAIVVHEAPDDREQATDSRPREALDVLLATSYQLVYEGSEAGYPVQVFIRDPARD